MREVRFGDANSIAGAQRCLYGFPGDYCGQRAVIHVWINDDFATMACVRHTEWWDTHSHRDKHPLSGACGLPNTIWIFTKDNDPGWCEIEGLSAFADANRDEHPILVGV